MPRETGGEAAEQFTTEQAERQRKENGWGPAAVEAAKVLAAFGAAFIGERLSASKEQKAKAAERRAGGEPEPKWWQAVDADRDEPPLVDRLKTLAMGTLENYGKIDAIVDIADQHEFETYMTDLDVKIEGASGDDRKSLEDHREQVLRGREIKQRRDAVNQATMNRVRQMFGGGTNRNESRGTAEAT